jgi:UDP-glucose 4-epimerase
VGEEHEFDLFGEIGPALDGGADLLIAANGGGRFEVHAFPPERKRIDIGDYYADDTLFRQTVGWQPATSLEAGLADTLAYYREALPRYL